MSGEQTHRWVDATPKEELHETIRRLRSQLAALREAAQRYVETYNTAETPAAFNRLKDALADLD